MFYFLNLYQNYLLILQFYFNIYYFKFDLFLVLQIQLFFHHFFRNKVFQVFYCFSSF